MLITSANWDSTHASVLTTSANWDSVYSWVQSDSATNNTDYNRNTFVNVSGDTINGSLSVVEALDVDGNTRLRGDLIVDGDVWFTAGNEGGKVTINLGDNDTDNIVFNADVNSNIAPDVDATYTLGTTAAQWEKLYVQDVCASNDASIENDLYVTNGDIIFGDNNFAHDYEHTPGDVEHLTKQDIRDFKSVESSVNTTSANWDSTHASVLATSSNWDSTHASVLATSSNWDSTHASVLATSSNWNSVYNSVLDTSANWDSVYSTVQADSATNNTDYNRNTFVNVSGDEISGDLTVSGLVSGGDAIFTSITALSSYVDVIDIKVRELSGYDIIDGDFGVEGSGSFEKNVYVTDGDIIFGDNNFAHDFVHTPGAIEHLSKQDVRDFKSVEASVNTTSANWDSTHASVLDTSASWNSVYNSVLNTSANWNSTHASVLATSSNWNSVYSSVLDTSANWDSTHASVLTTSANWDSVYSFVNTDSATNNTDYNRTTFVNTSGDTIDGSLTVSNEIITRKISSGSATKRLLLYGGTEWDDGARVELYGGNQGNSSIDNRISIHADDLYIGDVYDPIDANRPWVFRVNVDDENIVVGGLNPINDSTLTVLGDATVDSDMYVTGDISATNLTLDGEHLSKQDIKNFKDTQNTVNITSGDWNSVYSYVNSDSATNNTDYNRNTFVNVSGDTIDGDLTVTKTLSGQSAIFTSITALSSYVDVIDIKVRELSGYEIIDGDFGVEGSITSQQSLYVTDGDIIFGDNNFAHELEHTPLEVERLTKQDVRDFKSVESSVNTTSANWDTTHATVATFSATWEESAEIQLVDDKVNYLSTLSGNWDSTHASVLDTSANWDSTHASVLTTSGNWDSTHVSVLDTSANWDSTHASVLSTSANWDGAYSFVHADSATNNTDYNRTTFVNTSGDTITGDLVIDGSLEINKIHSGDSGNKLVLHGGTDSQDGARIILRGTDQDQNKHDGRLNMHTNDLLISDIYEDIDGSDPWIFRVNVDEEFVVIGGVYPVDDSAVSILGKTTVDGKLFITNDITIDNETLNKQDILNLKDTHSSVFNTSANWDSVYSFINADSATNNTNYNRNTFVNVSGDTIDGDLTVTGTVSGQNAIFTSITALSSYVDVIDIKVRELSGYDIIDGDFGVEGSGSFEKDVYVTDGDIIFGDSNLTHDHEHTPLEVERLTKQDVRDFKSVESSVNTTSANWDSTHASVLATSSDWNSVYNSVLDTSANWDSTHASVLATSSNWDSTHASVLATSSIWDSTHASVLDTSGNWNSVYNSVLDTSANWDSTHASVLDTSANWDSTHASVLATSSDWDSTHASVLDTSANWDSTHASVLATSGNWDSTHASVLATSANWDSTHASVLATSGNWDSTHASVLDTSANWNSVYSTVQADSATNNTDYNRNTFVNVSGDTVDGSLNITGEITAETAVFTSITALSSYVDVIDIKVRELSGYDIIDGDLRVDGETTTDILRLSDLDDPLRHVTTPVTRNLIDSSEQFVSDRYNYTHAVNVFGTSDFEINGVVFEKESTGAGDTWSVTGGVGDALRVEQSTVQGLMGEMLSDNFRYIVDRQTITLSNLTPGKKYAFCLYNQSWSSDSVGKKAVISSTSSDERLYVDQNEFKSEDQDGQIIEYMYVANSATVGISIKPDNDSAWNIYAFANREVWTHSSETLTSNDVTNFKSNYQTTLSNSGNWDSVYNFVNSDSATNNSTYNQAVYVNVSGDTMTGDLSVIGNIDIDNELHVNGYTSFTGGVTAEENVYVKGDLRVDGNVWMMSEQDSVLYVGENQDDVVVFQSPVDSHITPFKTDTHSLGTEDKQWANIYTENLTVGDYVLSAENLSAMDDTIHAFTTSGDKWNESYESIDNITTKSTETEERVNALYEYTLSNINNHSITSYQPTLAEYIKDEYTPGSVNVGDTVIVAGENTVYVLTRPDGTDINNWVVVRAKPNKLFYKTNLTTGSVIDTFDINRFKSAKYIIEIEGGDHIMFTELTMVTNGKNIKLVEYGMNYTSEEPIIEFEASLNTLNNTAELLMMTPTTTQESTWTPAGLSAKPIVWLDAANDSTVVVDQNNKFNYWENSGQSDLRMYSTPSAEPDYVTSGDEQLNGKNVLKFSEGTDFLQSDYVDGVSKGKWPNDPCTWFLVFKPTGIDNHHDYLMWFEQSDGQDLAIVPGDNDEFFGKVWMKENEVGNRAYPFTKPYSDTDLSNDWNIYELTMNPVEGKASIHLNGHAIQENVDMDYTFEQNVEHLLRLHANWVGSQYTDGYLAEFLVIDDYNRLQTEGYLAHKWGLQEKLPEDHLFKHVAPYMNLTIKGNRTNLF